MQDFYFLSKLDPTRPDRGVSGIQAQNEENEYSTAPEIKSCCLVSRLLLYSVVWNAKMAVHRDGLIDEEDNEEENALFEEDGFDVLDSDTPPHLRELALAAQVGDVDALRRVLGL